MLYLMRKTDESIVINGNITITIVEVRGKTVKLGFEFPKGVTVLRKEVHERIAEENKAALQSASKDLLVAIESLRQGPIETNKPKENDDSK